MKNSCVTIAAVIPVVLLTACVDNRNDFAGAAPSAEVSAASDLPAPENLSASATDNEVSLSWDEVEGASAYNVYVYSVSDYIPADYSFTSLDTVSTDESTRVSFNGHLLSGLEYEVDYYFKVTALADTLESDRSNEVGIRPFQNFNNSTPYLQLFDSGANAAEVVTLSAEVSDPDGNEISYLWQQVSGESVNIEDSDQPEAYFTAPTTDVPMELGFVLTVNDGYSATNSNVVTVSISDNLAPQVDAGADQSVSAGTMVNLLGSVSDSGGSIVDITWQQQSGSIVSLSSTSSLATSFTAPSGNSSELTLVFQLSATDDSGASTTDTVTVLVAADQGSTIIYRVDVAENSNGTIHVATSIDSEQESLTYSLSGTDADDFNIDSSSGAISFVSTPDYENPTDENEDNVYELTFEVSDGTTTTVQELIITVTDVDEGSGEAPVITNTTTSTEVEENTVGTIYTATASDDDGDALTYSLSGADADDFSINETSGEINFNPAPDFENPTDANTDNTYEVTLEVSDGTNTTTQDLTFTVTDDTDEAPVITSTNTSTEVEENTASTIYTATASDDDGDTLTYSLSGTDADDFTIDEDSGAISFNPAPDFENPTDANTDNTYEVTLEVSDGNSNTTTQDLTFTVTDDIDEAPVITSTNTSTEVEENTASTIYTATASDDDGDALTYSLSGTDADDFTIDEDSGAISFNPAPDFENPTDANTDNTYEVTLEVSDGNSNTTTQDLTFTVTDDIDEAPVITSTNTSTEVEENTASTIYTATASDDDGDALTYSLSGTDADDFTIDEDSGAISFNPAPDFENPTDANTDNTYEVTLEVSDGNSNTTTQDLTFTVTDDTDEAPVITSTNSSPEVEENTVGTIYTATASDDDGDALTYSLSGTDADDFTIDEDSGAISFNPAPDFENPTDANTDNTYEVTLEVSDGNSNTTTQDLTFTVTDDIDEAPVITSTNTSTEVEENTASTIYTATASDDDGNTLTYSLSGTDADDFTIDEDSGAISFNPAPDFENPTDANTDNTYEVTLEVSDGNSNTTTQDLTFTVTDDTDEAPVITSTNSSTEVEENTASTIYTATASDDDGDALTYSLSGADADDFTIDEDSGAISFNPAPDFENPTDANTDNTYEVTLEVSDGNSNTTTQDLTFTVTDDTDEAPVITSTNSSPEVEENTVGTIYTATASDDDGDALTYSLSGADADDFSINETSGEINFNPAPDFENPTDANTDNTYEVTLEVSDGNSNTTTQDLTFTVTDDTDEAPVITSTNSSPEVEENTVGTIYTATASDDDGDALTYSLSGADADDFSINETSGEINFNPAPDFENPTDANTDNTYEVTLEVSDGTNTTTQDHFHCYRRYR